MRRGGRRIAELRVTYAAVQHPEVAYATGGPAAHRQAKRGQSVMADKCTAPTRRSRGRREVLQAARNGTSRERGGGARSRPASPQGPYRAAGPYPEGQQPKTHVVGGVTAVKFPVVRAIVSRLGAPRILQFAYFFGPTGASPFVSLSRRSERAEPGPW